MSNINIQKAFGNVVEDGGSSFFDIVKAIPELNLETDSIHSWFSLRPDQGEDIVTLMIFDSKVPNIGYREDIPIDKRNKNEANLWGPQDRRVRATLTVSKNEDKTINVETHHYSNSQKILERGLISSSHMEEDYFIWQRQQILESISCLISNHEHAGLNILSDLLVRYAHDHVVFKNFVEPDDEDRLVLDICRVRQAIQIDKKYFSNPAIS